MNRDTEANLIADDLVFKNHRKWSKMFSIDRKRLRDLIAQAMKDHAAVCMREVLRERRIWEDNKRKEDSI